VQSTKPQGKDKERRKTNTPRNVIQFRQTMTYSWGREIFVSVSMSSLQKDAKGLQEISLTSSLRTKPNFYHFLNLFPTRDSMISLTQNIYKCFSTQMNPSPRKPTLKLLRLIS